MKDDELKKELEGIRWDIAERLGRVESKLWWIQGILASVGIALTVMIVRLLTMIK